MPGQKYLFRNIQMRVSGLGRSSAIDLRTTEDPAHEFALLRLQMSARHTLEEPFEPGMSQELSVDYPVNLFQAWHSAKFVKKS